MPMYVYLARNNTDGILFFAIVYRVESNTALQDVQLMALQYFRPSMSLILSTSKATAK